MTRALLAAPTEKDLRTLLNLLEGPVRTCTCRAVWVTEFFPHEPADGEGPGKPRGHFLVPCKHQFAPGELTRTVSVEKWATLCLWLSILVRKRRQEQGCVGPVFDQDDFLPRPLPAEPQLLATREVRVETLAQRESDGLELFCPEEYEQLVIVGEERPSGLGSHRGAPRERT